MSLSGLLKQLTPALSQYDPAMSTEGALDPLGLYPLADALATELCPGVRERQQRPGFLVPMVAGAYALREINPNRVALDGTSNPLQIFEWIVVLSLIETFQQSEPTNLERLPGRYKVSEALRANLPLSRQNYLKTPAVFGFFGVYRLLARKLFLLDDEGQRSGETALRLLKAWEIDHPEISGFSRDGGNDFSRAIIRHVESGLAQGYVRPGWDYAEIAARVFNPAAIGPHVKHCIWELLTETESGLRGEYANYVSKFAKEEPHTDEAEEYCHKELLKTGSTPMRQQLTAIRWYERVCRLLTDAFDEIRLEARADRKIKAKDLGDYPCIARAHQELPLMFVDLQDALSNVSQHHRAGPVFHLMEPAKDAGEWAGRLIQHHIDNQYRKPPNGKLPWIDRFDTGRLVTRPAYMLSNTIEPGNEYVHNYRYWPLKSFAQDLGQLP